MSRRCSGPSGSRSALIWTTTRSRAGGAGAIETPTPGAVPGFVPVVGSAPPRYSLLHGGIHSTVEWNRAAYRHLGVTRFEHHRDPGRVRRGGCEGGLILGFGLWRGLMLDRLPVLGQPALDPLHQLDRVGRPLLRRHLVEPVFEAPADVDLPALPPQIRLPA